MHDMKYKIDEELLDKIIAAAYKDAGSIDRVKIYFLRKRNPEAERIFNEYRKTALSVKDIPLDKIPDRVLNSLRIEKTKENKFFAFKPAYIFAVSLLIITITVAILINKGGEKKPVYSKAEIELAEEQVKASLAIVNKVFRKTENLVQEEVMPKRVGKPIHKSLTIINDVLIGG